MTRIILCLLTFILCSTAGFASPVFYGKYSVATDKLIAWSRADRMVLDPYIHNIDGDRYVVSLTKAQYDAGPQALDPAVKAAGKQAALDSIKDADSQSVLNSAQMKVLLDLINENRPATNKVSWGQFKQKVKVKDK